MVLLELAIQGVRGCSTSARVALKPGYTLLKGPLDSPAPLGGLLAAVCFPDGRGGDQAFLPPGIKAGRFGFSIQANNGGTFRLVKELGGPGSLHKLNPQTKAFDVVTKDGTEIGQTLRTQAGLPTRTAFEALYTLSAGQFPSRKPKRSAEPASPRGERLSGPRVQEVEHLSDEERKEYEARIPLLEKELKDAKELGEVQFRQDGLQAELFTVETRFAAYEEAKTKVKAARAEFDAALTPEKLGLPADIVDKVTRQAAEVKRRDEAIKKLLDERDAMGGGEHAQAVQTPPLWADQQFSGSMAGGVALTLAGAYLDGLGHFVALAAIAPWSFAAMRAMVWVDELHQAARHSGKQDLFATREKKLMDDRALAQAQIKGALAAARVESVEDFVTALSQKDTLQTVVGELEIAVAEMEVDPSFGVLREKVMGLRGELEKIQAKYQAMAGGYFRSVAEIEKELAKLKDSVKRTGQGGASTAPTLAIEAPAGASAGGFEDPGPTLLALAAEAMQADVASAASQVKDRCGQYLAALSDKKWNGLELSSDGRGALVGPGTRTAVPELSAADLDLYYVALRLTLVEKLGPKDRVPFVIEDCFAAAIDSARFPLLNRMLKHLGSVTQVLHVVPVTQNAFSADATVNI